MGLESITMEGGVHVRVGLWLGAVLSYEAVFVPLHDHMVASSTLERTADPLATAAHLCLSASEVPGLPHAARVRLLALTEALAEEGDVRSKNPNGDLEE